MNKIAAALKLFSIRLNVLFGSQKFFYLIVGFLIINALWMALASVYPMAFDENFHVGVIQLYTSVWSPFSLELPQDVNVYGSVETDPSYLFHYLMSFPYRFFAVFTSHEPTIIVLMRLINIAFFVSALFVYRKLLIEARFSSAVINVVMAVFVLIPVVPMLAGQVNYDNLLLLVVAGLFLYALRIFESLRINNTLPLTYAVWLIVLVLFGGIVKYAFLPLAVGVFAVLIVSIAVALQKDPKAFTASLKLQAATISKKTVAIIAVALIVSAVLFSQRIVGNLVEYGTFNPNCKVVLSVERCKEYGPWGRNEWMRNSKEGIEIVSFPKYVTDYWAWGMWHRLYFTVAGPTNEYATRWQLPVPSFTAVGVLIFSSICSAVYLRRLTKDYPMIWLFLLPALIYVGILIVRLYLSYLDTGRPVAINGRYLLPFMPFLGALGVMGVIYAFRSLRISAFTGLFALVVLILLAQGGGALTYIYYAESSWLWQHPLAQRPQEFMQPILRHLLVGR